MHFYFILDITHELLDTNFDSKELTQNKIKEIKPVYYEARKESLTNMIRSSKLIAESKFAKLPVKQMPPTPTKKTKLPLPFPDWPDNISIEYVPRRILLWAYFRAGSTYVGQLLSANHDSVYYFEPLHMLRDLSDWDVKFRYLQGLFDCNERSMNLLKSTTWGGKKVKLTECLAAKSRVMKVNRLTVPEALQWLQKNPNI